MPLGKPLLEALDRMGHGGLILDAEGRVLLINAVATALLDGNGRAHRDDPDWGRQALKSLLRSGERPASGWTRTPGW